MYIIEVAMMTNSFDGHKYKKQTKNIVESIEIEEQLNNTLLKKKSNLTSGMFSAVFLNNYLTILCKFIAVHR